MLPSPVANVQYIDVPCDWPKPWLPICLSIRRYYRRTTRFLVLSRPANEPNSTSRPKGNNGDLPGTAKERVRAGRRLGCIRTLQGCSRPLSGGARASAGSAGTRQAADNEADELHLSLRALGRPPRVIAQATKPHGHVAPNMKPPGMLDAQ